MGSNGYVQFDPAIIEQARQIDLLSYLQRYEPSNLKRVAGNVYCTRKHDSLKISNGKNIMERTIKRGDIFYADLNPVVGSEQGGRRPVLIISNDIGNTHSPTGIAVYHGTRQHHDDAELLHPCDLRFRKGRNGASGGIAESMVLLPPYYFWIQNYAEKHQDMPSISRYDKWRKSLKIQDLSPFVEI